MVMCTIHFKICFDISNLFCNARFTMRWICIKKKKLICIVAVAYCRLCEKLLSYIDNVINKNWPKTVSNNSKFHKRTLENMVALQSWDWRTLSYKFSITEFFKWKTTDWIQFWPFSSHYWWRFSCFLNLYLLSPCR